MKRFIISFVILSLMLSITACSQTKVGDLSLEDKVAEPSQEMKAKIATIFSSTHPMGKTAQHFADLVAERTDGKFQITVYTSEQLGNMAEAFDSVVLGMIEFDMAPYSEAGKHWAPSGIVEIPYMFASREHCMRFIKDEAFNIIVDGLTENVGITPLSSFYAGTRHTTTTKTPFTTPKELKDAKLKIRASGTYTTIAVELMGAAATPMALSEVYIGLQNGTVDGQENPAHTILSSKFYEVQDYLIKTGHIIQPQGIFVNTEYFNSLPEDYKKIIYECAIESSEYANTLFVEQEDEAFKELEKNGMKIIDADIASFMDIASDYHKKNMDSWGQELYDAIKAVK